MTLTGQLEWDNVAEDSSKFFAFFQFNRSQNLQKKKIANIHPKNTNT